jgi:hypothetical protein
MCKSDYHTDAEVLEISGIRLENTKNQPIIAKNMAKYGYNETKLNEGWSLLKAAKTAYNFKKQEEHETNEVKNNFDILKMSINILYSKHRKIAKVLFAKTSEELLRLGINGRLPENYVRWYETVNTFYVTCLGDQEIQNKLATMAVSAEQLNRQKANLKLLEQDRADYVRERGESRDATSKKDNAFDKLEKWMSEFKAVAKIALEEHPQLLEALRIKA